MVHRPADYSVLAAPVRGHRVPVSGSLLNTPRGRGFTSPACDRNSQRVGLSDLDLSPGAQIVRPNLTVNRARQHMLSRSVTSARRAGYLARLDSFTRRAKYEVPLDHRSSFTDRHSPLRCRALWCRRGCVLGWRRLRNLVLGSDSHQTYTRQDTFILDPVIVCLT